MTTEEKEEIITIIKDTLRNELNSNLDKEEMKKNLRSLCMKIESMRPYTCSNLKCKERKSFF